MPTGRTTLQEEQHPPAFGKWREAFLGEDGGPGARTRMRRAEQPAGASASVCPEPRRSASDPHTAGRIS